MRVRHTLVFAALLVLGGGVAHAQEFDPVDSLPISMQAQIGTETQVKCQTAAQLIPFTPVSGSATQLKCGDWVGIIGGHGNSYVVRTDDGSEGYVPAAVFPTDPCVRTNFRAVWFRNKWMPKFNSLTKDEASKLLDEVYLKATPADVSAAYRCLDQAMDQESSLGSYNGFMSHFTFDQKPQTFSFDERMEMIRFADALRYHITALEFLNQIAGAKYIDSDRRYTELVNRYNRLVDKYNDLATFVERKMRDLNSTSPRETQPSAWRRILAGAMQGLASYTPPKHIVCHTNGDVTLFGNVSGAGYIDADGWVDSHTDCREQ